MGHLDKKGKRMVERARAGVKVKSGACFDTHGAFVCNSIYFFLAFYFGLFNSLLGAWWESTGDLFTYTSACSLEALIEYIVPYQ